jgi:anti-sigma factor RsiW
MDGELPSPWKEKLENHLAQCGGCREKLENFSRLFEKPDALREQELMEAAKDRVWQNLESGRRTPPKGLSASRIPREGLWRRRISIPLPAAAAAVLLVVLAGTLWIRGGFSNQPVAPASAAVPNMSLATEEALPVIPATADMNGVLPTDMNSILQYLGSEGGNVIILQLPESSSFKSSGEPIIQTADYNGRRQ